MGRGHTVSRVCRLHFRSGKERRRRHGNRSDGYEIKGYIETLANCILIFYNFLVGMYIARQLSFHGVAFKIEEVPLSKEFEKVYDASVKLWVEAMQKFHEAAELVDAENRMRKTMWGQFWSSHQRFFKYLCIAAKVPHAVAVAHEAIKMGKCVVIGLQSTGEARTLEQLERDDGELTDFVSTAKGV